jgi:endonuclease/exonuclease/phosphatase family metal-dependent hydrolase
VVAGGTLISMIISCGRLAGSPGPDADQDTYRVNVLTYNVCAANNRKNTCAADLTPARRRVWASEVASLIRSREVDVASFTEMCYPQVSLLKRELPGYRIVWYGIDKAHQRGGGDKCRRLWGDLTDETTPPDGKTFGMALVFKDRTYGTPLRRRLCVDRAPADENAKIHPRGLLCARGMVGARRSVCCVTHISDTESPKQVTDLIAGYAGRSPVILSGDLNRLPGDGQLTSVYGMGLGTGRYVEVDAMPYGVPLRGGDHTTRGGRKIDYIFGTEDDFRAAGADVILTKPELSDHRALAGTLIGIVPRPPSGGGPSPRNSPASARRRFGRRR